MTPAIDSSSDLPAEGESERRAHLIDDLRLAYKPTPALSAVDSTIQRMVHDRRHAPRQGKTRATVRRLHLRLSGSVLALTVLLAGSLAYLHTQSPSIVSAQVVLQRASTAGISATTVSHTVYHLTASSGLHGTGDVWLEADASGSPVGFALTQTVTQPTSPAPKLDYRTVQTGGTVQTYDPGRNSIRTYPASATDSQRVSMFDAPFIALHLQQLASQDGVRVLPQSTLDGVPVTVLQTGSGANTDTFYLDRQSYVLRGVDWTVNGVNWQARLVSQATVPLSAVPATAFTLNAPADARVEAPAQGTGLDLLSLMAGACHSTSQAVLDDMRAHLDSTGLAICHDTNPGITSEQLVAALSPTPEVSIKARYFVSHPVRYLRILAQ